jgi:hypothetical protein
LWSGLPFLSISIERWTQAIGEEMRGDWIGQGIRYSWWRGYWPSGWGWEWGIARIFGWLLALTHLAMRIHAEKHLNPCILPITRILGREPVLAWMVGNLSYMRVSSAVTLISVWRISSSLNLMPSPSAMMFDWEVDLASWSTCQAECSTLSFWLMTLRLLLCFLYLIFALIEGWGSSRVALVFVELEGWEWVCSRDSTMVSILEAGDVLIIWYSVSKSSRIVSLVEVTFTIGTSIV